MKMTKLLFLFLVLSLNTFAQKYSAKWEKVTNFEEKGLIKSADHEVNKIYQKAKKHQNDVQIIKCFFFKAKYMHTLEEEAQSKIIQLLQKEISEASVPSKALLNLIYAQCLDSFGKSTYKIQSRTLTDSTFNKDFRTWSSQDFEREIDKIYQNTLADEPILSKTALSNYEPIFESSPESNLSEESLLEYILRENIAFYSKSPYLLHYPTLYNNLHYFYSDAENFLKLNANDFDKKSGLILSYFQKIETIKPSFENQLIRIKFFKNLSNVHYSLDKNYLAALNRLQTLSSKDDRLLQKIILEKAFLFSRLANKHSFPNYNQKAVSLVDSVIQINIPSVSRNSAFRLKHEITLKTVSLSLKQQIYPNENCRALVNFKNVTQLKLSFYALAKEQLSELLTNKKTSTTLKEILNKKPSKTQEYELPNKNDYFEYSTEILLPNLEVGAYFVSYNDNADSSNFLGRIIYVTNFAVLGDKEHLTDDNYRQRFQIVNRKTGLPIPNVLIHSNKYHLSTNTLGEAFFIHNNYDTQVPFIEISKDKDCLFLINQSYFNLFEKYEKKENLESKIEFFLDRAIYRPGQTVFFKGIAFKRHNSENSVLPNFEVKIVLKNVNHQRIADTLLTSNALGSFSGKFKLPLNCLTGNFTISVERPNLSKNESNNKIWDETDISDASINFKVEEYKRPKFEVIFLPNNNTYTRGQKIILHGKTKYLAGSSIVNAQVNYLIEENSQLQKKDTTRTDAYGNFSIEFKAEGTYSINNYRVRAFVTDANGETQEAETSIKAGSQILELSIVCSSFLETKNKNFAQIKSTNPNGKLIASQGEVRVYFRKGYSEKFKTREFNFPEIFTISREQFTQLFPFEQYSLEIQKDSLVKSIRVDTGKEQQVDLDFLKNSPSGDYYLNFIAKDSLGRTEKSEDSNFKLKQSHEFLNFEGLFDIETVNENPKKEGFVQVKIKSRIPNLNVFVTGSYQNHVFYEKSVPIHQQEDTLKIPIDTSMEHLLKLDFQVIFDGQHFSKSKDIQLFEKDYPMQIEIEHLRDKIQPNSPEHWSFKLNQENPLLESEVLASLYDSSLDNFFIQNWQKELKIKDKNYYYGFHQKTALGFNNLDLKFRNLSQKLRLEQVPNENTTLIWFGFDFVNAATIAYRKQIIKKHPNLKDLVWGIVTDSNNEPLPGVTVLIKGTSTGTATDADGFYSLKATIGQTLLVSYIGFNGQEIQITNQNLNIELTNNQNSLEEVVVVGYGTEKEMVPAMAAPASELRISNALAGKTHGIADEEATESNSRIQDFSQIKTRTNFAETAFFFPHIKTDQAGNLSFDFNAPEALTRWKLRLLAHNTYAQSAYLEKMVQTQKELMVIPNFPRFFREKDKIVLHSTISNLTNKTQNGTAVLQLFDAKTMKSVDANCSNKNNLKSFTVSSLGSTDVSWEINIPEGLEGLQYKILAKSDNYSDGEENIVPVLTNTILITESIPIWVKGNTKKEYTFENLKNNTSTTLKNHLLTFEYILNPTWSVLQSLPYLMEYEHECSEQTFARFYANSLASSIINSNPTIASVFDTWRKKGALNATLEQNETLKSIINTETPWVLDAQNETEKKKRVALLFDLEKMKASQNSALSKLEAKQKPSGGFAWFDGGEESYYITQHILAGIGHMKALSIKMESQDRINTIAKNAIRFLDNSTSFISEKQFNWYWSAEDIHYLYTRSFYLKEFPPQKHLQDSINLILDLYQNNWQKRTLYEKALLALVYHRFDRLSIAKNIIEHLKATASNNEDWGMYWIENKTGWYWYQAPIETQALLIEAFGEVMHDTQSVENMKVWLLKNKQIQSWNTTKATTEAIYALLMQGKDWLNTKDNAVIRIGNETISTKKLSSQEKEAETGYMKLTWQKEEINKNMATLSIENKSIVPSFGGYYWQYFEDLDKIKSQTSSLTVSKELYLKDESNGKAILKRITSEKALKIGDLVTVRLVISSKESIEYIHLKDLRASCFEPIQVLSHYEWKDNLGYYISTKDVATHLFFDKIPKGVYVIEYDMRVSNSGDFSNGITTIQSMYSPEFSSHSKGIRVKVTK